jgi:benzoate-CoA ligase
MANAATSFLDDHLAAGAGDRVAITTPAESATYRQLHAMANRAGHALRALGVEAEQRVALLLPDGLAWAATFFGALRIGAVAVPLNTRLRPADWVAMLADSRARVLVADESWLGELQPHLKELPHLKAVVSSGDGGAAPRLGDLLAREPAELAPEPVSGDDMALWLYTSGTTGGPKAAIHVHGSLLAARHYGIDVLKATEDDRMLATSRLFFAYALGNALLIPLLVGAHTFLDPEWPEPHAIAERAATFAPTLMFSVPTFYARMLRADLPRDTFRSVRACVSAGERLPPEIYTAWRERFGVEILDGLGATETIFMVLANAPGRSRPGATGVPVPGTEARLLDGEGHPVPDGASGVLHVRTPSVCAGYWNRIDLTRRVFTGEWLRTGDVLTRDTDGYYHHVGREDDFFKVAGLWVTPGELEAVFLSHPEVVEAGVVGAQDAGGLVKPFAFVVPRDRRPSTRLVEELTSLAAARLPAHQRPRRIVVVEDLPRTPTGKLQRFALRARAERLT